MRRGEPHHEEKVDGRTSIVFAEWIEVLTSSVPTTWKKNWIQSEKKERKTRLVSTTSPLIRRTGSGEKNRNKNEQIDAGIECAKLSARSRKREMEGSDLGTTNAQPPQLKHPRAPDIVF